MFDYMACLRSLKEMGAPSDLMSSMVLLEEPVSLRSISQPEISNLDANEVLYRNQRNTRKYQRGAWNIDMKSTGPGYFDEAGNYILSKPKQISISWILNRNGIQEGPFTDKEFRSLLASISYENCLVKRDFDKGFVSLSELIKEVPSLNFKELNKFFAKRQTVEEHRKDDDFFEATIVNEKSTKLTNFLKNHEISASPSFILKRITGMRKADAIAALRDITDLDKCINTTLVDLLIENAGYQVLSDVDKDGFQISSEKRMGRRK